MSQSRRWCLTLNNWTQEEYDACLSSNPVYAVVGKETGLQDTPHLQAYFVFRTAKRLAAVKRISERGHWEGAQGSTQQNFLYCSKDGDFIEIGIKPASKEAQAQGQHERWCDIIRAAREGTAETEYPREFIQYNTVIGRLYRYVFV